MWDFEVESDEYKYYSTYLIFIEMLDPHKNKKILVLNYQLDPHKNKQIFVLNYQVNKYTNARSSSRKGCEKSLVT